MPKSLHARATRAKTGLEIGRGGRLGWDEVMQEALDILAVDRIALVARLRESVGASPTGSTRMLQATVRAEQDQWLRIVKLDLEEAGIGARYEHIWALALDLWTTKYSGRV